MTGLTTRRQHVLTGAIAVVLVVAAVTVGVKGAFGAFEGGYRITGTFDAAGQGMLPGSDVKIRGVDVGEVDSVRLVDGEAVLTLRIDDGERIPVDATATIRPKTLFGEKYVDIEPGPHETSGPFLGDGDEITDTLGGFELEKVLTDVHPLLQAIDPDELMTVLTELAAGGRDLGPTINRSIANSAELAELFADNAELTSELLSDMAALSGQLADSADDLLGLADAANVALPTLVDNEDDVVALLQQAGRLSNDVADLLEANVPFVEASLGDASRTLQVLYDGRDQLIPTITGIRTYVQTFAIALRIEVGNGSLMAAVHAIFGNDVCGIVLCDQLLEDLGLGGLLGAGADVAAAVPAAPPTPPGTGSATPTTLPLGPLGPLVPGGEALGGGGGGLLDFLQRVLGG